MDIAVDPDEPAPVSEAPGPGAEEFRGAMAALPTSVSIVTTRDAGGVDHGFTAGSVVSASLEPPLVLVCLSRTAECHGAFASSPFFAVSVARYEHAELARRFAAKGTDKFAEGRFRRTESGLLTMEDARLLLECRVVGRHHVGDHDVFIGRVLRTRVGAGEALVFVDRGFTKTAPSTW
ncbi:flavin reductase family protein [Nocardiopsis xinjiangensis]|uniref:flavin reductase family protein n=1 Tax=Nocardiopsis xinjiangensis TaxID=124285 RepID=UPI00034B0E6F|nr:flavin reductase family protein [Nocardiopsis xinjiangensis]